MALPLLIPALMAMTGFGGMFLGSQIDDSVEEKLKPPAGGTKESQIPWYIAVPLLIGGTVAVITLVKKFLK